MKSAKISSQIIRYAVNLAKSGFDLNRICKLLELDESSCQKLLQKSDELKSLLKNSVSNKSEFVESALIKKAIGFEAMEKQLIFIPFADEENTSHIIPVSAIFDDSKIKNSLSKAECLLKEIRITFKNYPPDTGAAMNYLINRNPEKYSKNPSANSSDNDPEKFLEEKENLSVQMKNNL